ncbi:hypothetical protein ACFLUZ_04350 [Chloroflexota bacterium]
MTEILAGILVIIDFTCLMAALLCWIALDVKAYATQGSVNIQGIIPMFVQW